MRQFRTFLGVALVAATVVACSALHVPAGAGEEPSGNDGAVSDDRSSAPATDDADPVDAVALPVEDGATSSDASASPDAIAADATTDGGASTKTCRTSFPCAPGFKACGIAGTCLYAADPLNGCGSGDCKPCTSGPNVITPSTCAGSVCQRGGPAPVCRAGYANCDGDWSNGCESDLAAPATCGSCGNRCAAGEVCDGGVCAAACSGGRVDCGKGACEDILTSPKACSCKVCPAAHDTPSCVSGVCKSGASGPCDPGYERCAGSSTCKPLGSCTIDCSRCKVSRGDIFDTALADVSPQCAGGQCIAQCRAGYASCPLTPSDPYTVGCKNITTSKYSCGSCTNVCPTGNQCRNGVCEAFEPNVASGTGVYAPTLVAVDDTYAYYYDAGLTGGAGRAIMQVDKLSLARTQISAGWASSLATDNAYLYWTGSDGVATGTFRMPKGGGAIVQIASIQQRMIVDAANIYWSNSGFWRAPKDGSSAPVQISTRASNTLVQDATKLYGIAAYGPHDGGWIVWSVDKATGLLVDIDVQPLGAEGRPVGLAGDVSTKGLSRATYGSTYTRMDTQWVGPIETVEAFASDGCNLYGHLSSYGSVRILAGTSGVSASQRLRFQIPAVGPAIAFDDKDVYTANGKTVTRQPK